MHHINEHTKQVAKHVIDAAAVGTTIATVVQWLPSVAALLTIVWTLIRIIETETARAIGRWFIKVWCSMFKVNP